MDLGGVDAAASAAPTADDQGRCLIAFSGGPDSTALLHLACRLRDAGTGALREVHAAHVHHGLQAQADDWESHCRQLCAAWGVTLHLRRVQVNRRRGTEDGAREARYAALAEVAQAIGVTRIVTAHHVDDRLETFLLQWMRGAGPQGLAGGSHLRLHTSERIRIARPLLECTRETLEAYLQRHALPALHDPSNDDTRYDRNALRARVMPALGSIRSGYRRSAARAIDLIAEAGDVLHEVAQEGLALCQADAPPGMLDIHRLATLSEARQPIVLRAWLAGQLGQQAAGSPAPRAIHLPSRARLRDLMQQAFAPEGDGSMRVRLGDQELRRYRGYLCLRPAAEGRDEQRDAGSFVWTGEAQLAVPGWDGSLHFETSDTMPGFDPDWLRATPLALRARTGGERFKPHPLRPSKALKHWFQEAGVPEFERGQLPLLWREDRLVFVAGLGMDARLIEAGPERVRLSWRANQGLWATAG